MGRPPKTPWQRVFADLDKGDSKIDVCARYGLSRSTLYRKLRTRRDKPAPDTPSDTQRHTGSDDRPAGKPVLSVVEGGSQAHPPPPAAESREERRERRAKENAAEKRRHSDQQRARAARSAGFNRELLQTSIQAANIQLLRAIKTGKTRDARDLTYTITTLSEKLGAILSTESQFTAGEDTGPDLDSPEGRQQIADRLSDDPALLSLCDVDTLEAALAMARRKQA